MLGSTIPEGDKEMLIVLEEDYRGWCWKQMAAKLTI